MVVSRVAVSAIDEGLEVADWRRSPLEDRYNKNETV